MRVLASLVAAMFAFVTIEPLYGAPCPHHQPALVALAQGPGAVHFTSHEMAGHHEMTAAAPHGTHGSPASGHSDISHECHCLGACCGVTPVAIAEQPEQWVPATVARRISLVSSAPAARLPHTSAPHTLPDCTAPPSALLA
jgi:hypothetical protein